MIIAKFCKVTIMLLESLKSAEHLVLPFKVLNEIDWIEDFTSEFVLCEGTLEAQ